MSERSDNLKVDQLLDRAQSGDDGALAVLLKQHREALKRCIQWRIDPQLNQRLDASDVVQEAFLTAYQKFSDFCRDRPLPFFLWLRRLALDCLSDLHRRHLAAKRAVYREHAENPDYSSPNAIQQLATQETGPLSQLAREELADRAIQALEKLSAADRQLLILRYLEELDTKQVALLMDLSVPVVRVRQLRAIRRLQTLVGDTE